MSEAVVGIQPQEYPLGFCGKILCQGMGLVGSYDYYCVIVFPSSEVIFVEVSFKVVFDGLMVLKDGKFVERR